MQAESSVTPETPALLAEVLQHVSRCALRVRGDSMHPTIRDGDLVIVENSRVRRLEPGDIVVFPTAEGLCVHRVVGVTSNSGRKMLITAGDGNRGQDALLDPADVIGRVVEVRDRKSTRLNSSHRL